MKLLIVTSFKKWKLTLGFRCYWPGADADADLEAAAAGGGSQVGTLLLLLAKGSYAASSSEFSSWKQKQIAHQAKQLHSKSSGKQTR